MVKAINSLFTFPKVWISFVQLKIRFLAQYGLNVQTFQTFSHLHGFLIYIQCPA